VEDPGWDGVENVFDTIELEGMTCIRSSLKTSYNIVFGCKYIDDLAFTFIAPL
jgi:hypothetical protein